MSVTPAHPSAFLSYFAVGGDLGLCGGLNERQQLLVQTRREFFAAFRCDGHREPFGHDGGAELGSVVRWRCASVELCRLTLVVGAEGVLDALQTHVEELLDLGEL